MKRIFTIIIAFVLTCSTAFAEKHIKAKDIQKVNIGDTFDVVSNKIGDPHQLLSKERTADGKEKVVWLYESVSLQNTDGLGFILPTPDNALLMEKENHLRRLRSPPYKVIFTEGKVSNITRQQ